MPSTRQQLQRHYKLSNLTTKLELLNQFGLEPLWNYKLTIRQFLTTIPAQNAWPLPTLHLFTQLLTSFLTAIDHTITGLQHFRTIVAHTIDILNKSS